MIKLRSTYGFRRTRGARGLLFGLLLASAHGCNNTAGDANLSDSATTDSVDALSSAATINSVISSNKCLDVAMAATANGTPVQLATCNGNAAQSWTYTSGTLRALGKCLDVSGGVAANATKLQLWDCVGGSTNQQWTRSGNTWVWNKTYCMDLPDGSTGDGTRVQIWKCSDNSTPNQQFSYAGGSDNSVPNDVPVKTDVNSAFCLDVAGGATANGTPIQVATCNNNAAQKWNYDNGALKVFGNKCLDVPNGNASNGQQLQIWDCVNNSANQQWTISGNTLMFKNAFCIDLTNGNAANGQRVQIYGCGPASNVNQHWSWGQSSATAPANAPAAASPSTTRGSGKYMNLAWADEFSGSALDTSTWNYEVNCDGGFNNEMECYTSSPSNVYLDGQGNLVIHVQKAGGLANGRTFTSGRINTQNKKSFTYGRMEARLKVPSGRGLWPAFWAMPVNSTYGQWPTSGELDITEILGQTPGTNYGTVHYGAASPYTQLQGVVAGNDLSQNFHTYGLERDATQIRWYLDDVLFFTINSNQTNYWPAGYTPPDRTAWPFTQPFFAIFNLAIGGDWPGAPDASITSANLVVDYIRVYQ